MAVGCANGVAMTIDLVVVLVMIVGKTVMAISGSPGVVMTDLSVSMIANSLGMGILSGTGCGVSIVMLIVNISISNANGSMMIGVTMDLEVVVDDGPIITNTVGLIVLLMTVSSAVVDVMISNTLGDVCAMTILYIVVVSMGTMAINSAGVISGVESVIGSAPMGGVGVDLTSSGVMIKVTATGVGDDIAIASLVISGVGGLANGGDGIDASAVNANGLLPSVDLVPGGPEISCAVGVVV